ncbi:MAG: adenylate kinase family protein [Candidatus Aenigmatarchaeota archaeon]|nr:adenylate kinase family protein [Candidatus Aenigmarchaeota archaeon]
MKISITGTPGVGKTTVAKKLAKKIGFRYINVNELSSRFVESFDKKFESNVIDVKKMSKHIDSIKDDVVLDGHLSHYFKVDLIIILRLDPSMLEKRLRKRYKNKIKIKENVDAEILGVITSDCAGKKACEINCTGKKVEEIVEEIIKIIRKDKCEFGKIDWLKKYEKKLIQIS